MPYPNYHSCRLKDPGQYDTCRTDSRESGGQSYNVIYCKKTGGSMEQQSFRYPKGTWTAEQARAHCSEHDGSFEAAAKSVHVKSQTQDHYTVAGYAIVWGGRDLQGEFFEPDTDLWLGKIAPEPPLFYQHGGDEEGPGKSIIGRVTKMVKDEIGLWIEAQVDLAGEYARAILELVRKGILGLSTSTLGKLAEAAADGKILSWPIVEISLTPIPAEPRTIPVSEIKSLMELSPSLKSLLERPIIRLGIENGERVIRLHH